MNPKSPVFPTESAFGVFLASVAALLPGKWTAIPNPHPDHLRDDRSGQLRRDDGLTLDATANGYSAKGKIVLSYVRPRDGKGETVTLYAGTGADKMENPSIGCTETKTAEQVARDIERRLLVDAERIHALVVEQIAKADDYAARHLAALLTIAQAAGMPDIPRLYKSTEPRYVVNVTDPRDKADEPHRWLADVEVRGPDCIHFTLDTNCGQGAALIAFLRSPAYLNA